MAISVERYLEILSKKYTNFDQNKKNNENMQNM